MAKKLKILFVPIGGVGHVNACIGIAQVLLSAGHRTIFLVNGHWNGKEGSYLGKYGIEEYVIESDKNGDNSAQKSVKELAKRMIKAGNISGLSPLEKAAKRKDVVAKWMENAVKLDQLLITLLGEISPDLIVVDQFLSIPAIELSGIPYVWSWSTNPLKIDDDCLPPLGSDIRPLPKNVIRFDNLKRDNEKTTFAIPDQLRDKPGKLDPFMTSTHWLIICGARGLSLRSKSYR
ncbi:unnamed protein product [Medioppia subpectinata]|uniref:Uncharacterized protein n=1 Tax=Medioppia subpectinata TaxID=1979941 RepID=A0A7R9L8S2_9ACAR|nr:unnamed protein product [Medioppia subpectinata]CAG2116495.1 unnamed protein product [Medioppia subpectinata]